MRAPTPNWVDDLFPFPTPPALRTLIDIAWQHAYEFYLDNDSYDHTLLETHFDFMFDLAAIPRPPTGIDVYPEFGGSGHRLAPPHYATPEFIPFGSLGDGGAIGWAVPAPELKRSDHPVVSASGHDHGVNPLGADTRAGLEFMLSRALRRWRRSPLPSPPAGRDPAVWRAQNRYRFKARAADEQLVNRLAGELRLRLDSDDDPVAAPLDFDVPEGWRYEPGADGIGVLAPVEAFADGRPMVADHPELEAELIAARTWLDTGKAATALLTVKDTFVNGPSCYFASLKPLWADAYRALGRDGSAQRLDLMTPYYPSDSCSCPIEH